MSLTSSYLVKGGVGGGKDGEGSLGGQPLHHASSLEGSVQSGEVLILSDQGSHTLTGEGDSGLLRLLGGSSTLRNEVRVRTTEMGNRAGHRGAVREVIVETTDWAGHIT